MIAEIAASLGPGVKPGAVLLSVGGGGLFCGVVQGLKDADWKDVPIIAMETVGADCFNAAIRAGKLVTLDDITRSDLIEMINISACFVVVAGFICVSPAKRNVSEQRRSANKPLIIASVAR